MNNIIAGARIESTVEIKIYDFGGVNMVKINVGDIGTVQVDNQDGTYHIIWDNKNASNDMNADEITLIAAIVPASQNLPTQPNRTPLTAQELWDLVDTELLVQTTAGNTFTAYTITKVLRANHPELEIQHIDVQARVHYQMEFDLRYEIVWQDWNGEPARTYIPITNPLAVSPAALPQQQQPQAATLPGLTQIDWDSFLPTTDDPTV